MSSKNPYGTQQCGDGDSQLANAVLVSPAYAITGCSPNNGTETPVELDAAFRCQPTTSVSTENRSVDLPLVREYYHRIGLSTGATDVLLGSWAPGTKNQYNKPVNSWFQYCSLNDLPALNTTPTYFIEFLMTFYRQGLGYSAINKVRSALSSIVVNPAGIPIGKDHLVCRFLKGVFRARPSLPRYVYAWDVHTLFTYMRGLPPLPQLSLKQLTLSMTILLGLLSGSRCQTIHLFDLKHCRQTTTSFSFAIASVLKHTRPGTHQHPIVYTKYPMDPKLCVFEHLMEYLARTKPKRGVHTRLLLSYIKPHNPVTKDSVARWCSHIMQQAGIDTSIFAPHSTRSASTSAAFHQGCPLKTILDAGGWTREETFSHFYNKQLLSSFQSHVLSDK